MKKKYFFSISAMLFFALLAQAQPRIAVLDFNAGAGVSQNDVDGLSGMFNTYFEPTGYTVVERTRVSRILEEHNLQVSRLTEKEMVQLGQILNVSVIVIGDVNYAMKQYNIDVRAVNVETGAILAKDGDEWDEKTSYRQKMRDLAERMSHKIPIVEFRLKPLSTVPAGYRPTGSLLKFTIGIPTEIAYGYQVKPWLMIGAGVGSSFDFSHEVYHQCTPIFAEARFSTPRYLWAIFCDVKIGYSVPTGGAFYSSIELGVLFKRTSLFFGLGHNTDFYSSTFPVYGISFDLSLDNLF